ncbi:MFS transporter [Streptomyces fractus]|uniref:MFS transporter n=1 Tax=Streptomyces fractus TaxID=641806 RepID=UPI003CF3A0A4
MHVNSRWGVLAAFSLVAAATQMVWLTFAPVTTVATERYGVSQAAIGWLANVFVLAFVVLAVPAGFLLDRHLRGALILGAVLTAAGACLRLGGDSFTWMMAGGVMASLGGPIVLTGIVGLSRSYLRPEHRPVGIAAATACTWAGFVVAFLLPVFFSTVGSLPSLIAVHAGFTMVAAVALVVALRRPAPFEGAARARRAGLRDVVTTWRSPVIRKLCLFTFVPFGIFVALTTWTQALLEPQGVSVGEVGVMVIACVLAGVVGSAVIPVLAAKRGTQIRICLMGIVAAVVACAALGVAPGFAVGQVGLTVAGLALLPMMAIVLELVEQHSEGGDGIASGLVWTLGNLGGLVVSTVVGFTLDSTLVSYLLMGAVGLLALPVLAGVRAPVAAIAAVRPGDGPGDEAVVGGRS